MEQRKEEILKTEEPKKVSLIEKIGKKIPDPVIIFAIFYVVVLAASFFLGGKTFETMAGDGSYTTNTILNMLEPENVQWIFSNALLNNWLAYGGGVLGTILVVMLGVGLAEESGLLSTLIKKVGLKVSDKMLPIVLVFLGIMSSIATDAGYVILIPLAGLLYAGLKKNPLIGMAAAFAGVSAGFSANLIPATPIDIIIGNNAKIFAEEYKDAPVIYVMSSGATHEVAYATSICLMMEMQWINSGTFHSGEFFHGPFEIVEKDVPFILLMNDGRTRPIDSRALTFLERFDAKTTVIDALDFGLSSEISKSVIDYFNPMLLTSVFRVYAEELSYSRQHPLTKRRYMWKLEY